MVWEFLKFGPFQNILPKQSYFWYIEDALLIYTCETDLPDLVDKLNKHTRYIWNEIKNNTLLL